MKLLPVLLLCAPAYAALPPMPPEPAAPVLTIKRPAPFYSPKYASVAKETRMRVASTTSTEPPRLPMKAYHRKVQSEYGTDELTGEALQPANQSVLFHVTPDVAPGSKVPLAYFPAYPVSQPVFAGITTYRNMMVITANAMPADFSPAGMVRLNTTGPAIWVNPDVRGSFARRGVR